MQTKVFLKQKFFQTFTLICKNQLQYICKFQLTIDKQQNVCTGGFGTQTPHEK